MTDRVNEKLSEDDGMLEDEELLKHVAGGDPDTAYFMGDHLFTDGVIQNANSDAAGIGSGGLDKVIIITNNSLAKPK